MAYFGLKALDEVFHAPPKQLGKDYSADLCALPGLCRYRHIAGGQDQRGPLHYRSGGRDQVEWLREPRLKVAINGTAAFSVRKGRRFGV
jgi:hypothetical protein